MDVSNDQTPVQIVQSRLDVLLNNPVRKILHVDMDAFYASIEIRDRPELKGKPVVVGGENRGVVLTASYEARKFGVRSAMPSFKARQLCPQLIFVKPRFEAYIAASEATRAIFRRYTELIEPRSLDEAYLDVTHNETNKLAISIAREIKQAIFSEVGITCSVGVAQNKLVAKVASDFQKPDGLTVVVPERVLEFLGPLPLRVLPGVGPVTERQLLGRGLRLCRDIWPLSLEELIGSLGERAGIWIFRKSRGISTSPVVVAGEMRRKSLGKQRSLGPGLHTQASINQNLVEIAQKLAERLATRNLLARTVTLNFKHTWDQSKSRSHTLDHSTSSAGTIAETAIKLLAQYEDLERPIRSVGITLAGLVESKACEPSVSE